MINFPKLQQNLEALKQDLPRKPAVYTPDFPMTITEALTKYARQRTVHLFEINVYIYNIEGWPVPLYVDHSRIRLGISNNILYRKRKAAVNKAFRDFYTEKKLVKKTFWNVRLKPWDWVGVPLDRKRYWKQEVDEGVIEIFEANKSYFKKKLLSHPYLQDRKNIIMEILGAYEHKQWASCICTTFPLVDVVA